MPTHATQMNSGKINIEEVLNEIYTRGQPDILQAISQIQPGTQYPLLPQSQPSKIVNIQDVYTTHKEVGRLYDEGRLFDVLRAFNGDGQLLPIGVRMTPSYENIEYKILDGNHRFIASHLCGLQKIPVQYDQKYNRNLTEMQEKRIKKWEPRGVYRPPNLRN